MTLLVDLRDLRSALPQLIQGLKRKEDILVCLDQVPVALLTTYVPPKPFTVPTPAPDPHDLAERILTSLSIDILSRLVGLPLATFLLLHHHRSYAPETVSRLQALDDALKHQRKAMAERELRRWWQRRRSELGGRSAIEYLSIPWTSGDPRSETIFQLIAQTSGTTLPVETGPER